ncbi:glycoside hydrolase family 16 protein [Pontibacter anaerobius]|uniref:Glycoside hydrolase family 16 protein n=1 Tax=Pontibacter anaerobius TaxID=2993940 RepID=A0ABT3RDR3_9BACT|nr:glycoside hydrolase family 16 protein [Pontibacter anaerobius]MCX2739991.1 glycoside hydrolase family 16 protein [Pontibacter anaerobius]
MVLTGEDFRQRARHFLTLILLPLLITSCGSKSDDPNPLPPAPRPQAPQDKNWTFEATPVWADEFDYTGKPDNSKWGYDIGGNGWGNNELQYYTDKNSNASVADGILTITARKEQMEGRSYTSARLVTKNKGDFKYGRFEIKAKLPTGRGTWPAIWMLPTDWAYGEWPKSGEIDIMEHVGYDQNTVHITVHTEAYNHGKGTQRGNSKVIETASTAFHLYRVDWTPYSIRGFIDDQKVFEFVNDGKGYSTWPFDKRFHLLLNIAVGGNWGGSKGVDPDVYPQTMEVDYVRVYKMIE